MTLSMQSEFIELEEKADKKRGDEKRQMSWDDLFQTVLL